MSDFDARTASPAEYAAARAAVTSRHYRSPAPAAAPVQPAPVAGPGDDGLIESTSTAPARGPQPAPAVAADARKMSSAEYAVARATALREARYGGRF